MRDGTERPLQELLVEPLHVRVVVTSPDGLGPVQVVQGLGPLLQGVVVQRDRIDARIRLAAAADAAARDSP